MFFLNCDPVVFKLHRSNPDILRWTIWTLDYLSIEALLKIIIMHLIYIAPFRAQGHLTKWKKQNKCVNRKYI